MRAFDELTDCGAKSKRTGNPCAQRKGHRTNHPGSGNCWLHGGRTPNGMKAAAADQAVRALTKLGIPVGNGDPMLLLTKAVRHAEGFLEATGAVLADVAGAADSKLVNVEAIAEMHAEAIRTAARTGKAAVDADVADRMAALDERTAELVMRFVGDLFEQVVPAKRRPEMLVWARGRLAELAVEYEGQVH